MNSDGKCGTVPNSFRLIIEDLHYEKWRKTKLCNASRPTPLFKVQVSILFSEWRFYQMQIHFSKKTQTRGLYNVGHK